MQQFRKRLGALQRRNPCYTGKIQGIQSFRVPARLKKRRCGKGFLDKFPTQGTGSFLNLTGNLVR